MILTERLLGLLYFILVGLTQNNNIGILFWERCVTNCIRAFFIQESSWSAVALRKIRTLPPPNSTPTNKNSRAVRDSVFFTFQHTKSCQSVLKLDRVILMFSCFCSKSTYFRRVSIGYKHTIYALLFIFNNFHGLANI